MTRREWIAMIASAPLLKAADKPAPTAPVSIAKCASYDEDVTAKLSAMFDQLGGLERVVRNKTGRELFRGRNTSSWSRAFVDLAIQM